MVFGCVIVFLKLFGKDEQHHPAVNMQRIILSALLATLAIASPILEIRQNALSGSKISLLPLGDSITWGYDDPTGNGYRGPLYSSLKSAGVSSLDFVGSLKNGNMADPDNEGHIGWTISQIAGATSAISNLNPNVVLLHAGTNDAIQQSQSYTGAISNLQSLCDQIFKQWPNTVLLVAKLIPEMNEAPRQAYINQINNAIPGGSFDCVHRKPSAANRSRDRFRPRFCRQEDCSRGYVQCSGPIGLC